MKMMMMIIMIMVIIMMIVYHTMMMTMMLVVCFHPRDCFIIPSPLIVGSPLVGKSYEIAQTENLPHRRQPSFSLVQHLYLSPFLYICPYLCVFVSISYNSISPHRRQPSFWLLQHLKQDRYETDLSFVTKKHSIFFAKEFQDDKWRTECNI